MKKYLLGIFVFLLLVPLNAQADLFFGIGFGHRPNYPIYRQYDVHDHYHHNNYNYNPRIINNYYQRPYYNDNFRHIPQHIPQHNGPTIINNYYR